MAERPRNVAAQRSCRAHVPARLGARRENLFRRVDNAPRHGQVGCWSWQHVELSELLPHLWRQRAPSDSESLVEHYPSGSNKGAALEAMPPLERDDFSSNRHPALGYCLSMTFVRKPVPTFRDHALSAPSR